MVCGCAAFGFLTRALRILRELMSSDRLLENKDSLYSHFQRDFVQVSRRVWCEAMFEIVEMLITWRT